MHYLPGTRLSDGGIPTDAEQATGLEKKEYDALAAGIDVSLIKIYSCHRITSLTTQLAILKMYKWYP